MSAFDLKFIFSRIRERYVLTVFTLRNSSLAISDTLWPPASLQKIWNSRSESAACEGWSAEGPDNPCARRSATRGLTYRRPWVAASTALTRLSGGASLGTKPEAPALRILMAYWSSG